MAARDYYHDTVVKALTADGWTITHDPLTISLGRRNVFVDLGAEKSLIAAEKGTEKIAVEIKSFRGSSDVDQFEDALGQYLIYWKALAKLERDRRLFLAVPCRRKYKKYMNYFQTNKTALLHN